MPNKASLEVKEVCAKMVDDPVYLLSLRARLHRGKLAPAVECMLWHYAKHKPVDRVDVTERKMRALVIDRVSTRKEMLAALGEPDPDAGDSADD